MNLTMGLRKAIAFGGDAEALVSGDVRLDYRTFVDRVARLAAALRDLGMGDGDRVAMLAANGQHYIEYYFGVLWGGGVIVPINSRFALPEMIEQIRDAGPTILIVDGNFAETGAQLAESAPSVRALVYAGAGKAPAKALDYEAVLAGARPSEDARRGGEPERKNGRARTKALSQIWPSRARHEKHFDNSEAFPWSSFLAIVMSAKPSSSCTSVTRWKSGAS